MARSETDVAADVVGACCARFAAMPQDDRHLRGADSRDRAEGGGSTAEQHGEGGGGKFCRKLLH